MQYCKFLEEYRKFTSGNETPELIHLWVGMNTLAGACEKRIWIDQGLFRLYLNLYVLLVAPAGVCAKSTSMDIGAKLLREAGYSVMDGATTKEKIIDDMVGLIKSVTMPNGTVYNHAPVTFVANELNVLLSTGADMIKFLVEIWDRETHYSYKTKNSGVYEIPYPYFNFIAAAVPQWFGNSIAGDLGATGFLARCIIVYQEKKRKKVPRVRFTDEQRIARDNCLNMLISMTEIYGMVKFTPEADEFYDAWYMLQDPLPTDDYRMTGYIERRTKSHILKIAALMAIGDGRDTVEVLDFERAIHLITETEKYMRKAYVIAGTNPHAAHIHHIVSMLRATPGQRMLLQDIVRAVYTEISSSDFKVIIEQMESMSFIVRESCGNAIYIKLLKDKA